MPTNLEGMSVAVAIARMQAVSVESQPRIQEFRRPWNERAIWNEPIDFSLILNHFSQLKGGLADVPALQRPKTQTEFKDPTNIIEASTYL